MDCSKAAGIEVFVTIVGGQAPFRIQNPLPNSVRVDRTEASGKDPVFKVTSLGGCVILLPFWFWITIPNPLPLSSPLKLRRLRPLRLSE